VSMWPQNVVKQRYDTTPRTLMDARYIQLLNSVKVTEFEASYNPSTQMMSLTTSLHKATGC